MTEALKTPEIETNSNVVVIMFPDSRTTGDTSNSDTHKAVSELFPKLISRYKRKGFVVIGVVYRDTTPENLSSLFDFSQFNQIIAIKSNLFEFNNKTNDDQFAVDEEVVNYMNLKMGGGNIVVGGFHDSHCVLTMAKVLKSKGFNTSIDFLLTNASRKLILKHRDRKTGQYLDPLGVNMEDPYLWKWSTSFTQRLFDEAPGYASSA